MGKSIIFCADGTWNGPENATGKSIADSDDSAGELAGDSLTNVVKFYANLAGRPTPETMMLHNEQEKTLADAAGNVVQVAKYLHGVGDSNNAAKKVLGGVFGVGVIARIVRGYTFISRHYKPGDSIHIVGFSRGAYTARSLAGMIGRVGLLDPSKYDVNDKEEAYRRGVAAWNKSKGITLAGRSTVVGLANRFLDFVEDFVARGKLSDADFVKNVAVKSVAVWDTVGSMGVPLYMRDKRYDVFHFTDSKLSDRVEHGFHAMAIDELRLDFPVTKWDRRPGVEQVWFVGAHADVGGGYPESESRLSDVALQWLMQKVAGVGVKLATPLSRVPNCNCGTQAIHKPWDKAPFELLPKSMRTPTIEDSFHVSVIERWKSDPTYRPKALAFVTADNVDRLTTQS
jgi:glutathione S-transferase